MVRNVFLCAKLLISNRFYLIVLADGKKNNFTGLVGITVKKSISTFNIIFIIAIFSIEVLKLRKNFTFIGMHKTRLLGGLST